ncbi:class I SAM-dependent methyltransferase [uncultured Tenacibaculum sp.]|uniref:class I SAM-dependent methyltransferase n=1 Tax=uncultured Tenacibaculum sp. TaxID=174713 RepID=UPI00261B35FD|nr:class I SAM-dependent methyltransferase [uncultured Tenacibaculum sp.]
MNIKKVLNKLKKIKTIPNDDFINRLKCSVIGEGMLHEGNIFLINEAIKNMPSNGYVVEIGTYGGLSTNLILHLLKKHNKPHTIVGCDAWRYEGYNDKKNVTNSLYIDGRNDIQRNNYMQYIKKAYIESLKLLSPNRLPHTCHLKSDDFFNNWNNQNKVTDVFERCLELKGKISFCYIDGDHSYEQTKNDFDNVNKLLLKNGYVLIDDSAKHMKFGSAKFINDIKKNNNFKIVDYNPNFLVQKIN